MENQRQNGKTGCLTGIVILIVLGAVMGSIGNCSNKHHKRQTLILPEYSSFKTETVDPEIYFQTFDTQTDACLNFFWESGRSAAMYVSIKNGNDLYDISGSRVGYIIVKKDGSFVIKGGKTPNGHYYGVDGAKMSMRE